MGGSDASPSPVPVEQSELLLQSARAVNRVLSYCGEQVNRALWEKPEARDTCNPFSFFQLRLLAQGDFALICEA